ncbi:hypothetical protein SAMN06296386_10225 [Lachnospiraceae bacterium]|nr:hypothetical protein SAMN06296386_10225 [Lachnospiraceae bacterium]
MNLIPLTSVLLFCFILSIAIRRSNKRDESINADFLETVKASRTAPPAPLSELHFISFPEELLKDIPCDDKKLQDQLDTLRRLAKTPVINLHGLTNAEIRDAYGDEKYNELVSADERYLTLCRVLINLSDSCIRNGMTDEAEAFLLFAIDTGSDSYDVWHGLGMLYMENVRDRDALGDLIERAKSIKGPNGKRIQKALQNIMSLSLVYF